METMVEGLRRCGRNLTVENFVKAMEGIRDFKGLSGGISYGPGKRQGLRACFLARCIEDGKIERTSEWLKSDMDVMKMVNTLWE